MGRRIGIWGGAFDPIHVGHLILAQEAVDACQLDQLVWIPCGDPPHKAGPIASGADRARMIELAIEGTEAFDLSSAEIDRQGKSYTARTLEKVRADIDYADQLFLLIGADNAVDFGNWLEPDRVLELARVVVFSRPGVLLADIPPRYRGEMRFLDTPMFEVSSTAIRKRLTERVSIRHWVPESVRLFIQRNRLYHGNCSDG